VDPSAYDYVLDWVDNRFVLVSHKGRVWRPAARSKTHPQ
jgi:hypothetical protein